MQTIGAVLNVSDSRAGELDEFRSVVERYSRKLFRLAFHITRDEQDAEDVVQETFLRVYRHRDRLRKDGEISLWIHRITANCAVDQLRRRKRTHAAKQVPLDDHPELGGDLPGPERASIGGEMRDAIERQLERLSPNERTAFVMRHYEGMTIREIGRVLGTRESATKNHIFRAVRKLRRGLGPLVEKAS